MKMKYLSVIALGALPVLSGGAASAQADDDVPATAQAADSTPAGTAAEEDSGIGLNIDLGFATSYIFRGLNLFADDEQLDPNMMLAPGVTWSIFDTGLSVGYLGAWQLNGDSVRSHINGGVGAEQDIILGYELGLPHDLALSFGLVSYLYPWATKTSAGTECPFYLEPGAGISWAGPVDLGLGVSYVIGVQDEIRAASYLYLHPTVGKSFSFGERVGLDLGLGYGFKLWKDGNDGAVNVHDVAIDVGLPISIAGGFYVTPSVHAGWTNLGGGLDFADEIYVYGGLNVGIDL